MDRVTSATYRSLAQLFDLRVSPDGATARPSSGPRTTAERTPVGSSNVQDSGGTIRECKSNHQHFALVSIP